MLKADRLFKIRNEVPVCTGIIPIISTLYFSGLVPYAILRSKKFKDDLIKIAKLPMSKETKERIDLKGHLQ